MLLGLGRHLLGTLGLGTGQQDPGALRHPLRRVPLAQEAA
jgi:hypothetical protein